MPLSRCPRTGKLFDNSAGLVHPDAHHDEEADYTKILDYLAEHPNAKPPEVMAATGVTQECINRMVKSGRVMELDDEAMKALEMETAERSAEIARRNQRVAQDISTVLRQSPSGGTMRGGSSATSSLGDIRSTLSKKREM